MEAYYWLGDDASPPLPPTAVAPFIVYDQRGAEIMAVADNRTDAEECARICARSRPGSTYLVLGAVSVTTVEAPVTRQLV